MAKGLTMKKRVRALLLMKDITCAGLAREVGVSRTWVSLVVNGHKRSVRLRKVIADAIGAEVGDLWPSDGNGRKPKE